MLLCSNQWYKVPSYGCILFNDASLAKSRYIHYKPWKSFSMFINFGFLYFSILASSMNLFFYVASPICRCICQVLEGQQLFHNEVPLVRNKWLASCFFLWTGGPLLSKSRCICMMYQFIFLDRPGSEPQTEHHPVHEEQYIGVKLQVYLIQWFIALQV
jgi:hypothetical protein